jgi:CoA:oxalate CoA-transferase
MSANQAPSDGALRDITVLDLSLQLPGPYATMLLRSLGARVIKVEPPGGDPARTIDPQMFALVNGGKESVQLNLRVEEERSVLHALVRRCDVLIEGFRPRVAARLGFDYETISRIHPGIVYCSLSGYGQTGPYRDIPGHDLNYLGVGGAIGHQEPAAPTPQPIGMPVIDLSAGTAAALAITAALRERDRTGHGRYLDVAMLDSAVFWSRVKSSRLDDVEPAYAVLRASDGGYLSIAVIEDKFWRSLCEALDWRDWLDDVGLADHEGRKARAPEILTRLARSISERPRQAWLELFGRIDVPAAPVHAAAEASSDPQVIERGLLGGFESRPTRPPLPRELLAATDGLGEPPALDGARSRILSELGLKFDERVDSAQAGARSV